MNALLSGSPLPISIQGPGASQRVEQALPPDETVRVGRSPVVGWAIPWDRMISREHADLRWNGARLLVQALPKAQNPLLYQGKPVRELSIEPGDWFQIGQSTFQTRVLTPLVVPQANDSTAAYRFTDAIGYTTLDLRKVQFQNASQQLELLADLPQAIRDSLTDDQLCRTLSQLLLAAIPQAEAVAVAHFDLASLPTTPDGLESFPKPLTMRMEQRPDYRESFQPSRRLILQALRQGRSLLHISSGQPEDVSVTQSRGLGWSFCCPVAGDATNGWCLYVSGKGARSGAYVIKEEDLAPDLRFTELVAQFLGSVRQVRLLQEQKTQLSTFFSPKVIESLSDVRRSNEFLAPAERNVTVLFCDVRGFSRKAEALEGALMTLLHSVSGALQVMAGAIQDHDGTIADFQGDAALGFWGWPVATIDGPLPACRAALQIEREFRQGNALPGGPLEGFAIGLGIAHGRAVAGQIGTPRQAKVGVFGPVVNQGSRLEGLTKQFGVSICLDEATAQYLRTSLPPDAGRLRRLAKVRPKGMETPLTVYALLPPATQHVAWTMGLLDHHEEAVDALLAGRWDRAREIWLRFPTTDGPAQRLLAWMADLGDRPPDDWDGAFTLANK